MPKKNELFDIDGIAHKRCGHCEKAKPAHSFNKCCRSATGLRAQCKECMAAQREALSGYYKKWRGKPSSKRFYREYRKKLDRDRPICRWARNKARSLEREPCEVCGEDPAEAHHTDYLKPLDVMWLCRKHHNEWHHDYGPGLNAKAPVPIEDSRSIKAEEVAQCKNHSI